MNWFKKLLCKWFNIGCQEEPPQPPATGPSRGGLYFCYFAGGDPHEFVGHTNLLFIGSWGDWLTPIGRQNILNSILAQMQAAHNAGLNRIVLMLDWCLFTPSPNPGPLSDDTAVAYLRTVFDAIVAGNFENMITAWYVYDEPDIHPTLTDFDLQHAANVLRYVVGTHYPIWNNVPLQITYGDKAGKGGALPGVQSYDWCGFDNYCSPIFSNGEYDSFVSRIAPTSKTVLFPGGASPWRQDPGPFYDKAQTDPRVQMIMPFMWFDNAGEQGIKTNGMAPTYTVYGEKVKTANP
jgi:hypothetical protein